MKTTQQVLDHHMQAFGEGLDSILSDFDDNSCVISQQATYRGMTEIRAFFTAFVAGLPEGFMDAFKITKMEVAGEVAYITWEANPWFPFGTDTFVVKNGKINYQTFAVYSSGK
ncbi:MAG: nuclear transport factor 2 family protein [Cyclobacteriaceae bacterium]|nr:nuclear transport factor 2 family protein [Cyclobacteriaceae bacterium]MDH4297759.1 nuclear transport factor 2 family protein [Cyclobacteriaceae bacterium]MDH5249468.1 nuclear transport factor 2 family protein [Cyclobacteriaceae bacterium]